MAKNWARAHRDDPYHRAAKKGGYRARSAFKLKQLQDKFKVFKDGQTVVDLGAAPGGWSQVAHELVGESGFVVGVDLVAIRPLDGVTFVRGDMTDRRTVDAVLARIAEWKGDDARVDIVISDMSPNISGNYSMDQARSYHLCMHALRFADQVLRPGGHFVGKIFEGEDFPAFREAVKQRFRHAKTFSPPASRKESSEVYVVGKDFQGAVADQQTPTEGPEETVAWWDDPDA